MSQDDIQNLQDYLVTGLDGLLQELRNATELEGKTVNAMVILTVDSTCLHAASYTEQQRQKLLEQLAAKP